MTVPIGVVVIGRNEGERLARSLASVLPGSVPVVYVDSGSTDGSAALARSKGAEVIELEAPFSAPRGRNEGFRRLRERFADLAYVQFVDGDCELAAGWLQKAERFLAENPRVAVVCGRLRERQPQRTVYSLLCDILWDAPPGETRVCGGIAMVRVDAFESVRGFRDELTAGADPELCLRLRAAGWRVWRLEAEMATAPWIRRNGTVR